MAATVRCGNCKEEGATFREGVGSRQSPYQWGCNSCGRITYNNAATPDEEDIAAAKTRADDPPTKKEAGADEEAGASDGKVSYPANEAKVSGGAYPEHDKLQKVLEQHQICSEFFDYLEARDIVEAEQAEVLLAGFFRIDLEGYNADTKAMGG